MRGKEKGGSAVEFAVILPLLILILFGITEFSILMYDKAVLTNACREGARTGILMDSPRHSPGEIKTIVSNYCENNLVSFSDTPAKWDTSVKKGSVLDSGCADQGDIITVSVSYPYSFLLLPNLVESLTGPLTLKASSVMRCE